MSFSIIDFINDKSTLNLERFRLKYKNNIPSSISISESISVLKKSDSLNLMIDDHWYGDKRDKDGDYLIKKGNQYEVFESERFGRHCLVIFDNLEEAIFAKLDSLFNGMYHSAPDSIINK